MKRIYPILFIMALSGCSMMTPWKGMSPGTYKDHGRQFITALPDSWMKYNYTRAFIITRDGLLLNRIVVQRFRFKDELEYTKKKYAKDMLPQDLADLEIDNYKANEDSSNFLLIENNPALIDGQMAYHLRFTERRNNGLNYGIDQYGFIYNDRVYRIYYEATEQYYYGRDHKVFEKFIEEFRLIHPKS